MIVFVDVDDPLKVTWPPLILWALFMVGTITVSPRDGVRVLFCGDLLLTYIYIGDPSSETIEANA